MCICIYLRRSSTGTQTITYKYSGVLFKHFFISEQTYRSSKRNFILILACSPYPRSEQHSFTPDKQFPYNGRVRATFDDMCQCQELVVLWPSIIAW